ncbi:MAG TPA: hypothetical protein VFV38_10835 [Ktedonobacteraceae bacterium]|nr:hypothetical protein [Ktedonobacteraceae bacterium]
MLSVAVRNNLTTFVDAMIAGDKEALTRVAHETIARAEDASELIGKIGLIAMHGDSDGHAVLTLSAASMLCRRLIALRHVLGEEAPNQARGIPLVVQALLAAAPAVKIGKDTPDNYPEPLFPSGLPADETVGSAIQKAIYGRDTNMVERLLFGLYGTGADYRSISIRIYDGIAQTFQESGHALLYAVRGSQVLDAVEWGEDAPHYIHWLAPHLPIHSAEPDWIAAVRGFLSEPGHSLASYRTRLAAPHNEQALPLRALLLSDTPAPQICQATYDALISNGASARGVGSVIALAACDLLQACGDNHDLFVQAAHGLLYASATRLIYTQVQEVEALPALFTAATYVNALYKELGSPAAGQTTRPGSAGGGLIAPTLLESLSNQVAAQDITGAMASARRYIQLGHDMHALFGVIGLEAARVNASADQGHTLQIVQAAGEEYLAWPEDLASTNMEGFLQVALRAAALAQRNL